MTRGLTRGRAWAALAAVALAGYANTFGLGMAQDSRDRVLQDPRIREATAANLAQIFTTDYWWPNPVDRLYRPLATASLMVNYAALGNGASAAGYHVVNVALHAVNAGLVYEVALLLLGAGTPALLAAALWALHPIGTEPVANLVGRSDLMATAAVLLGLLLYVRGAKLADSRRRAAAVAALFAVALAGMLSKESAAVLIGLMLLWDLAFDRLRGIRQRLPFYGAAGSALAILLVVRARVFAGLPWPQAPFLDNVLRGADTLTARFTAVKVIGLELWLLLCPVQLASDRSFNEIALASLGDIGAWVSLLVALAILALAVVSFHRRPLVFFLVGFYAIALLPASNLVLIIGSVMAERFLYLPAVAFAIGLAALAWRLLPQRTATVALAVLAVLYAGRTFARNSDWDSDESLAVADVSMSPSSARLHHILAKALFDRDERRNIDRAIAEQELAWSILRPVPPEQSSETIPAHLGIYYFSKAGLAANAPEQQRQWRVKAVDAFSRAREIALARERAFDAAQTAHGKPLVRRQTFTLLYPYLGYTLLDLGRYDEALTAFRVAQAREPGLLESYDGMAAAYARAGRPEAAAVAVLAKAQAGGAVAQDLRTLAELYRHIPGGECAVNAAGALNVECPKLRAGLCLAAADVANAYTEARVPGKPQEVKDAAARSFGCPAAALSGPVPRPGL